MRKRYEIAVLWGFIGGYIIFILTEKSEFAYIKPNHPYSLSYDGVGMAKVNLVKDRVIQNCIGEFKIRDMSIIVPYEHCEYFDEYFEALITYVAREEYADEFTVLFD